MIRGGVNGRGYLSRIYRVYVENIRGEEVGGSVCDSVTYIC